MSWVIFIGLLLSHPSFPNPAKSISKLMPETNDTTSFFSFYDVAEKIGIVIGMLTYGYIADMTGRIQNAILFLILFLILLSAKPLPT